MEDHEILLQFNQVATKEAAFNELVIKYRERLYWHIRRLIVDHDDTDDVLQNTFLKVWKALSGFKEHSQLYTWLYRIATNESLSFIEQKKRKSTLNFNEMAEALSNQLKADANFDSNRLEWKLQLAIQQLPEKQRIVFGLRYFEEMSYDTMSELLGTSAGALKASFHHAAKKVEEFIKNN